MTCERRYTEQERLESICHFCYVTLLKLSIPMLLPVTLRKWIQDSTLSSKTLAYLNFIDWLHGIYVVYVVLFLLGYIAFFYIKISAHNAPKRFIYIPSTIIALWICIWRL